MDDVKTSKLVEELADCRSRQWITAQLVRQANLAGVPSFAQWVANTFALLPSNDAAQSIKDQWAKWECEARQLNLPSDQFVHLVSSSRAQSLVAELVRRGREPEVWGPFGEPEQASSSAQVLRMSDYLTIDNKTNDAAMTAAPDIPDLLKFLAESDDWATGNKLLEPILFAAVGFYNRQDDDASCRALSLAHGIITININGCLDEIVKGLVADMAVVASFLQHVSELSTGDSEADAGDDDGGASDGPPPGTLLS